MAKINVNYYASRRMAALIWIAILSWALSPYDCKAQLDFRFEPIPNSNINSPNPVQALDVNYANEETARQAFHLFLPDTVGTYPLVIYFHGGGFTGGSRDIVLVEPTWQASMKYYLENGIAFASVGYRLISSSQPDEDGVIKCLNDSKRGLQFIRHHAQDLNIDPTRIGVMGSSAGAGTALWLASRNDMADPSATDLVLRESTRVNAVQIRGSQATYDMPKWDSVVFAGFDFGVDEMIEQLGFDRLSNFYGGIDSYEQLLVDPDLIQYRQDVDMLAHLSSDDPPLYILSRSLAALPEQDVLHHGAHSAAVYNYAMAAQVPEVKALIRYSELDTTGGECGDAFLARHLEVETYLKGDLNGDGRIDLLDVSPFVEILSNQLPFDSRADVNCDGVLDLRDVDGFILLLTNLE